MESDPVLLKIFDVLVEIKELLAKAPAQAPAKSYGGSSGGASTEGPPPQPTVLIDEPGDVQCHFGKNNGKPLSEMTERQLAFYASVKEPRLDSSGKAFPPRPQDVKLENAARQLWHRQKGSLTAKEPERHAPPPRSAAGATTSVDDSTDVPFAARYYDHG